MQIKNCAVYLTTNILINTQKSVVCIHFNRIVCVNLYYGIFAGVF